MCICVCHRYFDAHGNYYAKEDPNAIQDTWLEDVDWARVREGGRRREGRGREGGRERRERGRELSLFYYF